MTRLNSGVIILSVAALLSVVSSGRAFAQTNPKEQNGPRETGAAGGGERGTSERGASNMGAGGNAGAAVPSGGAMAPSPTGSTGGNWSGTGVPASSGGSPTYGDSRRSGGTREPRSGGGPTKEASLWFSRPRENSPANSTATVPTTPVGGRGSQGPGRGAGSQMPGRGAGGQMPGGSHGGGPSNGQHYGSHPGYYGNYGWGMFGFGYSYLYDPFWLSYGGYPDYGYGYGYGGGYGDDYGLGYGWGTGSGYASPQRLMGSLKLKVKPAQATVYVDGYYSGRVDDFDGTLQKLRLEPGPHRIEISALGFKSISFEVNIRAGESINFQGELEIIR